jgi:uncharacterized protein YeaC (DUF1315 family)
MFEKIVAQLPKEICKEFRFAVRNGCWRSGMPITKEQRRTCLQALLIHESNTGCHLH